MTFDVKIVGADKLERVADRLKKEDDKAFRKRFRKAVRKQVNPLIRDIRSGARNTLPKAGGLADLVARSRMAVQDVDQGKQTVLRLRITNKDNIRRINDGTVRHPLFGNRNDWYDQRVTPGWATKPFEARRAEIETEVLSAVEQLAADIAKER